MDHENQETSKATYDCLLFDLDDTLYPLSSGIAKHCSSNIQEYMVEKLGIDQSHVGNMCYLLYKYYGTTMSGLKAVGYDVDYDDYHSFVHGRLPYELLKPDPVLKSIILSLPIRKAVFTNSDKAHALRALERLGLEDCFDTIICFETLNPTDKGDSEIAGASSKNKADIFDISRYASESDADLTLPNSPIVCKPFEESFERAFKIAGIDPQKTLFCDDSIRNLMAAKRMGLHTVLVGSSQKQEGADYALESIHNIKEAFPELWEVGDKEETDSYTGKVSIQTSVPA